MKITKDMKIVEVLQVDRSLAAILMSHGMGCLGCPSASMESLEQAAMVHGIDVEKLLSDLNNHLEATK